jgi:hypothetical protein
MNVKEKFGRKLSRPNMRRNMSVCCERLKNADISWDSRSTNRDMNPGLVKNDEWYTVAEDILCVISVAKIVYKHYMNRSKTFHSSCSLSISFVSSWLHLRVLEGKAKIETAQERLCNGSLPSRKGHSNMELRVINIDLAVPRVEMCAIPPKRHIRPHSVMYRISLFCLPSLITHSYRSHMVSRFLLSLNISFWSFKLIFRALLTDENAKKYAYLIWTVWLLSIST